jgi:glutamate-ammonia-ligase adenylyltransferase
VLLKTTRTRTNLAKCAPALFEALSRTPDPDLALGQFQRIVDSIGAKSLFYELLGETPSMLNMVVQLAVFSEFLTELLVRHPGMLDELMDSLQTGRARSHDEMAEDLSRLLEGAVDPDIILKSWQAGELLRIGTRDLLHAANLGETFRELTALAEVILEATVHRVWHSRGDPQQAFGGRFAVIGLGKLGGREMTYGSDLDLIMVHEGGSVAEAGRFVYLGQVLMRNISAVTEHGKLYDLDMRLRPMGRNSPLVPSLGRYREYARTSLQFWERLALTRARCVAGDPEFGKQVETFCRNVALGLEEAIHDDAMLSPEAARREVAHMRARIQESAPRESLKKGHGGLVDIEFIVQTLQVIHGAEHPKVRTTNTYDALHAIHAAGLLSDQTYSKLLDAYRFLRMVESRLRIVHGSSAERLPQQPEQLELLARRAGYESADETAAAQMLLDEYRYHTQTTRSIFEDLIGPPA